jgi:hypothetical protein
MLLIALAAQMVAPVGPNPASLVRNYDLPIGEFNDGAVRTVSFRLTVRPDGSVQGCEIEIPSGKEKLDRLTCKLLRHRARYKGARGPDGEPAYAVVRNTLTWAVNPVGAYQTPLDAELRVSALPKGQRSPVAVRLIMAVDPEGRPSRCIAGEGKPHPSLVRLACDQLLQSYKASPARNDAGETVASVQEARVAFVTD